jgi:N-acetylglucosamine kinase-like BadF-type ATPase
MSPDLVLGIDGGGTSTSARLADGGGRVLGRGRAGPSNLKAVGPRDGLGALDAAIATAFREAGLEPAPVAVACLGLAGYDRPEDRRLLDEWNAGRGHARRLRLVNDGELVVAAGTPEGWGIGLIAGTGSICVGIGEDGRRVRAGGWGPLFGDEGSAYAVALGGLRLVARRADGRRPVLDGPDELSRRICERLGVREPGGLITAVYGRGLDRATLARLAPLVVEAAESGDRGADGLLADASRELASTARAVWSALGAGPGRRPAVALAGGFLLGAPRLRRLVAEALRGWDPGPSEVRDVPEPVEGAVSLALRELR